MGSPREVLPPPLFLRLPPILGVSGTGPEQEDKIKYGIRLSYSQPCRHFFAFLPRCYSTKQRKKCAPELGECLVCLLPSESSSFPSKLGKRLVFNEHAAKNKQRDLKGLKMPKSTSSVDKCRL